MAHPCHVVVRRVQLAVGVVSDLQLGQRMARFELERSGSFVNAAVPLSDLCESLFEILDKVVGVFSSPSEMRSSVGVTPAAARSASLNCLWVVDAGWVTTVIESPIMVMLAAR